MYFMANELGAIIRDKQAQKARHKDGLKPIKKKIISYSTS